MKHRSSSQRISKGPFAYYSLTLLTIAGGVANAQNSPGVIRGAIVTIESDGSRSMIPGATVAVESAEVARQTMADNVGSYTLADLPAGRYQIRANAPGLAGSTFAEINSGESLDVEIVMAIENVKLSITVNGNVEPPISAERDLSYRLSGDCQPKQFCSLLVKSCTAVESSTTSHARITDYSLPAKELLVP